MSNNTNLTEETARSFYNAALWYAWGRQDAQHNPKVDVFAFASHFEDIVSRGGHRPSIQDAFATYVASLS